jgi:hypothetical protein|tara:strand:- start:209 stop:370 length:162 start_codon:yes stop_codon:yes gene_type:complete
MKNIFYFMGFLFTAYGGLTLITATTTYMKFVSLAEIIIAIVFYYIAQKCEGLE